MEETITLTEQELNDLKLIQEKGNQLMIKFGEVEMSIQILELQKENLVESLSELKQRETTYGQMLQDKYGSGNINTETGEFTKIS
jgi:hypothetical protein